MKPMRPRHIAAGVSPAVEWGVPPHASSMAPIHPTGMADNSPAFQRWVHGPMAPSPEGTAEPADDHPSLRDLIPRVPNPSVETLGYSRRSFQDSHAHRSLLALGVQPHASSIAPIHPATKAPIHPAGMADNSPAFQRWVHGPMAPSPEGTAESSGQTRVATR